jgi:hypothetical protein
VSRARHVGRGGQEEKLLPPTKVARLLSAGKSPDFCRLESRQTFCRFRRTSQAVAAAGELLDPDSGPHEILVDLESRTARLNPLLPLKEWRALSAVGG